MQDYRHRHVITAREGEFNYYAHVRDRKRGTVQFFVDSRVYVYKAQRGEARDVKRWFAGTGDYKITGKFPVYHCDQRG